MKTSGKLILLFFLAVISLTVYSQNVPGSGYKNNNLNSSYNHTKWGIEPNDLIYKFTAFTSSFDSDDDNNGDGKSDSWGIPEWVAYEVKKQGANKTEDYNRPNKWMTDDLLAKQGKAPNDETYAVSGTTDLKEVSTDYRYVRGHMCPKDAADRIGMEAGYNTHTVLNAVPQLQWQNNGIWKNLEQKITDWADKYESVWVVCGPVFFNKTPAVWLGQDNEVKAAIPDAIFKIVIRESKNETGVESFAFVIPNIIPKEKKEFSEYLTSIKRIEELTGLKFLVKLQQAQQMKEKSRNSDLNISQKKNAVISW